MSIRLQFLRETWAFLRTFTGRPGEVAIDSTNNRLVVHDGTTAGGFPMARADQVALAGRTSVADANYVALATDVTVAYTALTAARTVTLPATSAYPAGRVLTVLDESGACALARPITLAAAGADTINGAASLTLAVPYGALGLMSNGAGKWILADQAVTALQMIRLGIGTAADATNPFAAKLNKALWTALTTGEGGTGDLRYTLNKEASGNTLSLLFQSGFSGRAELGLTGDDDLHLKVSADGGTWREALRIDRSTGGLDLTAAEASAPVAATVDLGALPALKVALTGTGTITSFGTSPHRLRLLRFTGAVTLTHNAASLVLPGGGNLVTAAGDTALAVSDASGNWRVLDYARASGRPLVGPAAAEILDASASGRAVLTGTAAQGATALGLGTGDSPSFASLTTAAPANLGTTAGSASRHLRLYQNANNNIYLDATLRRHTAGSDWTGTNFRLQRAVDATPMGFIDFGVDGVPGSFGLGFGTGSTTHVTIDQGGGVGIGSLSVSSAATFAGTVRLAPYTVATLPAGVVGALVYVSNGRKPLEGAGAGTGVVAYFSNGNWRRLSDDSPVAA